LSFILNLKIWQLQDSQMTDFEQGVHTHMYVEHLPNKCTLLPIDIFLGEDHIPF